jgi:hypothetical protein
VELLYFEGCPNWQAADEALREVAERRGLAVKHRKIETVEQAEAERFMGSPTILINGRDPFATPGGDVGFACRIYQTPTGPAGSPTAEQLEEALEAAAA